MTAGDAIEALPVAGRWDFGGIPYGLEPLTLPAPAPAGEPADGADPADPADGRCEPSDGDLESSRHGLRALSGQRDPALPAASDGIERVFWFRWITGHQTTFILWQLLARSYAQAALDADAAAQHLESCRVFVRGYSAMLLYTGSCPRDVYHRVIRPSMALQHPGFSGSWARDFWPVRRLLRPGPGLPTDTALDRERELNVLIHQGVAEKLVPDGLSLLQAAVGQDLPWRRSALSVLYDNYFLTLRAPVPRPAVVRQLMRRLHAIGRDLAANGLYPPHASSAAEKSPGLRERRVDECERTISETLFEIATRVAQESWQPWEVVR